jgi:hypothetical protein
LHTRLLKQLREKNPQLFQASIQYYHKDLIHFAVIEKRWEDIPVLLAPFRTGDHLDIFTMIIAQLKYHGQVKTLIEAMTAAYPKIQASSKYVEWADEEFAGELMELILADYLETTPDPSPDDPHLLEATATLLPWKEGWLDWFIPSITRPEPTDWKPADFSDGPGSKAWRHQFSILLVEFIAAQWRDGIPLSRGLLAWDKWGELFYDQFEALEKSQKRRKGNQKARVISLSRYFLPDAKKWDRKLTESFSLLGGEPYEVAAAMELLPAYLDFVERFGLIQSNQKQQAIDKLKIVVKQLPRILAYYESDLVAIQNMVAAWDER